MLDGRPLIDVHLHPARRPTVKVAWDEWAKDFGAIDQVNRLYDTEGTVVPERFDALLAGEGVDVAMVLAEYSPRVTGVQAIEDMVPLAAHNPDRIKLAANLNPHLHYPVDDELQRQLDLGAIALKIHPVHAGVWANDRSLYPAYAMCQDATCRWWCTAAPARSRARPTRSPTRSSWTTSYATSGGSTWSWPTAAAAGGTTPPRSWPWPANECGSSCPACPRPASASTTAATTGSA